MKTVRLPAIIKPGESGYFIAEIPVIPGCFTQGKTKEEALVNIKEAAELCLETMEEEGWNPPEKYVIDQIEVAVA